MKINYKKYFSLACWVVGLLAVGAILGAVTKPSVESWYKDLSRSPFTPPDYAFGIVWSILYIMIAVSGWIIWNSQLQVKKLNTIKKLFMAQLLLNWSWTPLFFGYELISIALGVLLLINILVFKIIYLTYHKISLVAYLMIPYSLWLIYAGYLNFYIWFYN